MTKEEFSIKINEFANKLRAYCMVKNIGMRTNKVNDKETVFSISNGFIPIHYVIWLDKSGEVRWGQY